jgi:ubiquinone/menaquinone biosynthesis C-methylase UbiE
VDYSEEFIHVAQGRRPELEFKVMNAIMLDYPAQQFDIVVSGCCIMHMINWPQALQEAARVAKRYVVLHRTPIAPETTYYFKKAYGVDVMEIHFKEKEILDAMWINGYAIRGGYPISKDNVTYLMERRRA